MNLRIREIRIEKNMSLRQLAGKSKISKGHLSDLEDPINPNRNPTLRTICKIAKTLEVDPRELFECDE